MNNFFTALWNPDLAFLHYALFAGLAASVAFGVVGSYVVVRRISYIAGAIAHCVLGGIGAALFLQKNIGITWFTPMFGAVIAALLAAVIIGWVSLCAKEREDSAISAIWVIGMAAGILFISQTPGYIDAMSYLFGNILFISQQDMWFVIALDILIVIPAVFFYNKLLAVCFDEEFSLLRGVRTKIYYFLLLCLTALTIVLLVRIVGIVMVIALLTLPSATAARWTGKLWRMMIISAALCAVYIVSGLAVSYHLNIPTGATIVILAGMVYLLAVFISKQPLRVKGVFFQGLRKKHFH